MHKPANYRQVSEIFFGFQNIFKHIQGHIFQKIRPISFSFHWPLKLYSAEVCITPKLWCWVFHRILVVIYIFVMVKRLLGQWLTTWPSCFWVSRMLTLELYWDLYLIQNSHSESRKIRPIVTQRKQPPPAQLSVSDLDFSLQRLKFSSKVKQLIYQCLLLRMVSLR